MEKALFRFSMFGIVLLLTAIPAMADWPVRKFEVFLGTPMESRYPVVEGATRMVDELGGSLDSAVDPPQPVSAGVIDEIESYLEEVALELDRMGFASPVLEPVIETGDGAKAYRIYLSDFGGGARYRYDCKGEARRTIRMDVGTYVEKNRLTDKAYQDLAHELFHAVQQGHRLFEEHCDLGDWITEGTAQAVGADLAAWSSRKIDHPHRTGDWTVHRWGLRFYHEPLWIADDDESRDDQDYGTSSFWRFLGEHAAAGGGAGTKAVKPDYRYLADLFDTKLDGRASEATEIGWLHGRLRADPRFRLGLDRLYPNFITTFASYVNTRFKPADRTPEEAEDRWLQVLFDTCPVLRLDSQTPLARVPVTLDRTAAGCFRLDLGFSQPVDISVHAMNESGERMKALSLGTEQGAVVAQPAIVKLGQDYAFWLFHVSPVGRPIFVLSNMGVEPESSTPLTLELEIAASGWQSSMQAPPPPPPPPSSTTRPTSNPAGRVTNESQTERVAEQVEVGLDSLSPHLAMGAQVSRYPEKPPCESPFVEQACGPTTQIHLALLPGVTGSLEHSTGRGGTFGQFASIMGGIGAAGPAEVSGQLFQSLEQFGQIDGAEVRMVIPLIDYGFTGAFENAMIWVHASGGGTYQAIGQEDQIPGPGSLHPLSGRVVIEEYTPTILRGSFRGDLVDKSRVSWDSDDVTLPIHESIEGSFTILAPWRGDQRVKRDMSEDALESVEKDLIEMFPGMEKQIGAAIERARTGPDRSSGAGGGGGASAPRCDCSCNYSETADRRCEEPCFATWEACKGQRAAAEPAEDASPEELEVLRDKFADLLEQNFPGPNLEDMRSTLLETFDAMSSIQQKKAYFSSFGGRLEDQP